MIKILQLNTMDCTKLDTFFLQVFCKKNYLFDTVQIKINQGSNFNLIQNYYNFDIKSFDYKKLFSFLHKLHKDCLNNNQYAISTKTINYQNDMIMHYHTFIYSGTVKVNLLSRDKQLKYDDITSYFNNFYKDIGV